MGKVPVTEKEGTRRVCYVCRGAKAGKAGVARRQSRLFCKERRTITGLWLFSVFLLLNDYFGGKM